MTFTREPLSRDTLRLGIREQIRQAVTEAQFYHHADTADLTDIKLLRYVSSAGKEEWFDFLIKNGDFFDQKGKIRKEFGGQFDECIIFAVNHGHVAIARKLFGIGAKVRYYVGDSLQLAIMNNNYDMAELCFEMGAKIRTIGHFTRCLKKADDQMIRIIEKHKANIIFMLVEDKERRVNELLEKRKNRKGKTV